jgi:lipopolysaccharide transport system ATP-binding protein
MEPIVKVENLGKKFILSHQTKGKYVALRDVIADKVKSVFSSNKNNAGEQREEFWALKDVSFEINKGDRIGIIGRNGAGKSTLLKILSRITEPTEGVITIEGRVSSLLEVGTGFHPELTGRENIFLNGSILGMGRKEIEAKFDEIVAFAEVEKFLDTPVKRYSSGMYVRLAFAVAAHLEPEILIIDEVLAVGDAAFQKKCLGKIEEVSGQGRTVLFVSHNMQAVQRLCNKGILLQQGKLIASGSMESVIEKYLDSSQSYKAVFEFAPPSNQQDIPGYVTKAQLEDTTGNVISEIPIGRPWQIRIRFKLTRNVDHFIAGIGVLTQFELPFRTCWTEPKNCVPGEYEVVFINDDVMLTAGIYKIVIGLSENNVTFQFLDKGIQLHISQVSDLANEKRIVNTESGLIINQMPVQLTKLN